MFVSMNSSLLWNPPNADKYMFPEDFKILQEFLKSVQEKKKRRRFKSKEKSS